MAHFAVLLETEDCPSGKHILPLRVRQPSCERVAYWFEVFGAQRWLENLGSGIGKAEAVLRIGCSPFPTLCEAREERLYVVRLDNSDAEADSHVVFIVRSELFRYHQVRRGCLVKLGRVRDAWNDQVSKTVGTALRLIGSQ